MQDYRQSKPELEILHDSLFNETSRFAFGISNKPRQNVLFLDETTVAFPSGGNIILYNIEQKSQRFIPLSEYSQGISAMALTTNRKFFAVAEIGKMASISIYDTASMRKKKTLSVLDSSAKV